MKNNKSKYINDTNLLKYAAVIQEACPACPELGQRKLSRREPCWNEETIIGKKDSFRQSPGQAGQTSLKSASMKPMRFYALDHPRLCSSKAIPSFLRRGDVEAYCRGRQQTAHPLRFLYKKIVNGFLRFLALPILLFTFCLPANAQEYTIQSEDRLSITFWQEPNLNTEVKVGMDGKIELPIIGRTQAAGYTTIRLGNEIVEKISRYRIKITQVSVKVVEYAKNKIYITGQVGSPGTHSFERIPNLWNIIQEAGGFLETANLEKVTIIRAGKGTGLVSHVDMNKYFENSAEYKLPPLRGGDTIHVPTLPAIKTNSSGPSTPFSVRNEIYILGEVVSPGKYNLEKDITLLDAVILAGGPTNSAKLSQVRILKRWQGKSGMMKFNLEKYLNDSEPIPPNLFPGDTIFIPKKKNVSSFIFSRILLPVFTSASVFIIANMLR